MINISRKGSRVDLNIKHLGSHATMKAVGYGNDGKNEEFLVEIQADNPRIQEACDAFKNPHITLSIGPNGNPKML